MDFDPTRHELISMLAVCRYLFHDWYWLFVAPLLVPICGAIQYRPFVTRSWDWLFDELRIFHFFMNLLLMVSCRLVHERALGPQGRAAHPCS